VAAGRQSFVFRIDTTAGNTVQRREIEVGARRAGEVEVLSGLAAGDRVVVHGTQRVRDGQAVQLQAAAEAPEAGRP
jgi:membrane fusion protein (multidrug efflux system)